MPALVIGLHVLSMSGELSAQGAAGSASVSQFFDVSQVITLSGRVTGLYLSPGPHAYVVLEVSEAQDTMEWAIEGSSVSALRQRGWRLREVLKLGDVITASAYRARPASKVKATVPSEEATLIQLAGEGRLVHGIELTLRDGRKLPFADR